jgi:hydrogenase expression/formation protein HypC
MCLAVPALVKQVNDDATAVVDLGGVRQRVSIALLDSVVVGDYLIIHVGYALSKLDQEEAQRTLELLAALGEGARA